MAIRNSTLSKEDKENIQLKSERFLHLMNSDWTMELNSFGDSKLRKNRHTNEDKVPEGDDVSKFCQFMIKQISQQTNNLLGSASHKSTVSLLSPF